MNFWSTTTSFSLSLERERERDDDGGSGVISSLWNRHTKFNQNYMAMFLRRLNKARYKNRGGGQQEENSDVLVTGSNDVTSSLTTQPMLLDSDATHLDASNENSHFPTNTRPTNTVRSFDASLREDEPRSAKYKRGDKQLCHPSFSHTRQVAQRQSPNNMNKNMMPDSTIDLNNVDADKGSDDRTISLLETECINLTYVMSLLRDHQCKYTEEWFVLENRLKIASEELGAAKEDRELHFLSCSSGFSTGEDDGVCSDTINASQLSSPSEKLVEYNEKRHALVNETEISTDVCNQVPAASVGNRRESEVSVTDAHLTDDVETERSDESLTNRHVEHHNDIDCNTSIRKVSDFPIETHRRSYQQIKSELQSCIKFTESELQSCIKFTPAWFQLKEELVELAIELANVSKDFDNSDDESSMFVDLQKVHDRPREIPTDGDITSLVVPSPPMSPISQGSLSSPNNSHTLSPIANNYYQYSNNSAVDENLGNSGSNPNNSSALTHHRTASGISGKGNKNIGMYCYSFNGMERNDDSGKAELDEDNRNTLTNRLKTEHASLVEEAKRHPQFSTEWFEVKMKIVSISEKIVRLELEEVTTEVLTDYHTAGGDVESLGGDSSKYNISSSGWSSVDVWSESEDEIWSYADDLDVCMVSEALKQNSSQVDELFCMPQQDFAIVAETVIIQAWIRRMINRGMYLRQRQMAIRIQSWQRSSSIRSGYKQIRVNATVIQGIVRQWLSQRGPQRVRKAAVHEDFRPIWKDAVGEWYGVTIISRTELKTGASTSNNRPVVRYKRNDSEKNEEKVTPKEEKMVSRRGRIQSMQ